MSLGEHLTELRNRLMICAIAVVLLAVVGWFAFDWVFAALQRPFRLAAAQGLKADLNFQGVGTGLNVKLQMSAYVGLLLSSRIMPRPGFRDARPAPNERKYAIGFFGAIPLFFLGCAAGCWAVNQLVPVLLSPPSGPGRTADQCLPPSWSDDARLRHRLIIPW